VIGWDDLDSALDAVRFCAAVVGFRPRSTSGAGFAVAVEAAAGELLAAMGQELRVRDRALYRAWFRPGSLVVVVVMRPSGRQAGELVDKVREFASRLETFE
jgi:hypothetical protein